MTGEGFDWLDSSNAEWVLRWRDRVRGVLLGLALGESASMPTQLRRAGSFTPVRDLFGGGPFDLPRGAWADETAIMLCVATSLLDRGGFDSVDQLAQLRRWQQWGEHSATGECLGLTAAVSRALVDGAPDIAWSDGSDALTRLAPLVVWHLTDDGDALSRDVASATQITSHQDSTLQQAQVFSLILRSALHGATHAALCEQIAKSQWLPTDTGRLLGAATAAFCGTRNWKDAVLEAINQGGDSDVLGALCGQLAGAHYGASALPVAWLETLAERDLIERRADSLLAAVLVGRS
ncbi:MAG: ADP-ribosylglycohydrolase family protein [Gammaproteobacteria bacterium]|nr:ADP-ribosylglycohydrolase family protein [Gammaproteobacteria bacterium]